MNKELVLEQLQKLGVTPKKGKGQNFLISQEVIEKTIAQAQLTSEDEVVEVGPGLGFLTQELLKNVKQVHAIELERNFCTFLADKFKTAPHFQIICEDILQVNVGAFVSEYIVVANLPYAITSPVLQYFLYNTHPPKRMIVMVQKEVGERICAVPGQHSVLSLSVQRVARPRILFDVAADSFYPVPQVDSVVLEIDQIRKGEDDEKFFALIKRGFAHKRKKLVTNLVVPDILDSKKILMAFQEAGISENARAQELSLEQWTKLLKLL